MHTYTARSARVSATHSGPRECSWLFLFLLPASCHAEHCPRQSWTHCYLCRDISIWWALMWSGADISSHRSPIFRCFLYPLLDYPLVTVAKAYPGQIQPIFDCCIGLHVIIDNRCKSSPTRNNRQEINSSLQHTIVDFVRIIDAFIVHSNPESGGPIGTPFILLVVMNDLTFFPYEGYYAQLSHPLHVAKNALYATLTMIGDIVMVSPCYILTSISLNLLD